MARTNRKVLVALAAMITFLALVAAMATVPTAQASELQGRRVATKFKKVNWPPKRTVFGTPTSINGKIKSHKRKKRVVVLQQKLPSGWRQVDRDKTNKRGRFHLKAKTNWYHQRLDQRVVVMPTRRAAGNATRGHGFTVKPPYAPAGSKHAWTRIAPGHRIQFNPCRPVRWKLNTQYAPPGVKAEVKQALQQLSSATGIRFPYAGKTHAIPGSSRSWPGNTNMVVAWADPSQTKWDLHGNVIGRGGQLRTAFARGAKGKHALQITRSGLVLDNTFPAPAGFVGPNARGAIIIHELGHVVGLGHTSDIAQMMYPSAENVYNGVYQAGDLTGLRHVGLMTGCLKKLRGRGRELPGYVPPPEPVALADRS